MEIHQVLVTATPGDAITNSALELRDLLRRIGPSEIFARYLHPDITDEVHPLHDYDRIRHGFSRDDLLLFHASIGEPHVFEFVNQRPERLVLMYHNISPASWFYSYDPAFAGLLEGGRRELAELSDRAVLALAASQYNADELIALGYRDVRVARLIVDVDAMREIEPDPQMTAWLDEIEGPALLFVGQLLPHKRPELLLKMFHVLSTYLVPDASLLLVGANRLPGYAEALERYARELQLGSASFRGTLTPAEWAAHWRRADLFVTASEHEGFLVPILEAWAFEVPVVARDHAAIPETLGDAGILLPAAEDAVLFAEAVAAVLEDPDLQGTLRARGTERLAVFDPDSTKARILEHLLSVA